ncbi:MAG: Sensor histidine kinase RcsC [bacterium ADurb.Bin243]|nr:MAG: Sensor histidine kinase RcsC [bacterium ADurb.Bin243]
MEVKTAGKNSRQTNCLNESTSYNILVIDDDMTNSYILFEVFSRILGHTVRCANNGAEGVEVFKSQKFDIVITDINMPGLNGYETAELIRSGDKKVPILALTGSLETDLNEKIKKSGINAFVSKPYNIFSLALLINSMIENSAEV